MWGYSFHSAALHTMWLENLFIPFPVGLQTWTWIFITQYSLRGARPQIWGPQGVRRLGARPASRDAPADGPPPERLVPSLGRRLRVPGWAWSPLPPFLRAGPRPSAHLWQLHLPQSRSRRLFRPLPFDRARPGAQVLSPGPKEGFATEPTTFHSSPRLILPDSACWNAPAPRRSIVAAPIRTGSP